MSLSDALDIVRPVLARDGVTARRAVRAAAVTYLNWWHGHAEAMPYSDPTGERAVRRILAAT